LGDTRIRLANTRKFRGEIGLDKNKVAVRISEKLEEKEEE
jgi:flagellar motor switch protein FliM